MNFARRPGFRETRSQTQLIPFVHLGNGANEEQLEKLADQFILGDQEIINSPFFLKNAFGMVSRMEV
jgi:hypothetical protein